MSGGGLVRRGGYLCECDDGRWVRVFGPARDYWRRALASMAIGTARESAFFQPFEDGLIDAPEWIPAGGMWGDEGGAVGALMRLRGGV